MQQPDNSAENNIPADEKTIYIGSDHAGHRLKNYIKSYLSETGYYPIDLGNEKYEPGDDYPDFAAKVANEVSKTDGRGILICDSGVGVCVVANKIKGIRAVNASGPVIARMSREHNNTNVLCLGQNYIRPGLARKIIKVWLETEFSKEERHHRRVNKIEKI